MQNPVNRRDFLALCAAAGAFGADIPEASAKTQRGKVGLAIHGGGTIPGAVIG